jgi:hypothetical protein
VSAELPATDTERVTVAVLPEESVALAASVCVPGAVPDVDHAHDQADVPLAGCQAPPSTESDTDDTLVLSAALPVTVTVPDTVAPAAGALKATVGAAVSAVLFETDTLTLADELLPLVSTARAVSVCVPLVSDAVDQPQDQELVPDAADQAPPSTDRDTDDTAALSLLDPETVTDPVTEAPDVGAEIVTPGAVRSAFPPPLDAASEGDTSDVATTGARMIETRLDRAMGRRRMVLDSSTSREALGASVGTGPRPLHHYARNVRFVQVIRTPDRRRR